jgi:hypothetical protein
MKIAVHIACTPIEARHLIGWPDAERMRRDKTVRRALPGLMADDVGRQDDRVVETVAEPEA